MGLLSFGRQVAARGLQARFGSAVGRKLPIAKQGRYGYNTPKELFG